MSKTDKTRPWWVRASERAMVTCVPVHHHEDGVCDLPEDPAEGMGPLRNACYWTASDAMMYGRGNGCGCAMCTNQWERRVDRRRERRDGRRRVRDAEAAFRSGDIDEC